MYKVSTISITKRKKLRWIITISLFFISLNSFAQTSNFRQMTESEKTVFIRNMQTASKSIQSLQCNFIQKKTSTLLKEPSISKGMMYFQSPNALRWEYTSPQAFAFIMKEGKSIVKNSNGITKLDAQSSKMIKSMTEMIMGMINGKGLVDSKDFTASYFTDQKQIRIKLTPKNSKIKMVFTTINVYVDAKTYLANVIEMNEAGDDMTTITLLNIKKNVTISDDKFKIN